MRGISWMLLLVTLASCEDVLFEEQLANTPVNNFEHLWQDCRDRYSFFELKGIDWDQYYEQNRPLVSNEISRDSLFKVLGGMLTALRDGHVNLVSPFNVSRFDFGLLGPVNFDWRNIKENYIGPDYLITGPFSHDFLAEDQVGYIRYASFQRTITAFDMAFMFNRYRDTRGLIIDVRSNGGGSISNVYRLLNRFQEDATFLYTSSIKNGPGENDFSEEERISSEPELPFYLRRVVVLTDRQSYSASSLFALGARSMPNMTVMGDTTGGGLGLPNGGQLPNGWTYRFSVTRTLDPDGNNFENGVPPDIVSILSDEDRISGRDQVIEDAIEFLLN